VNLDNLHSAQSGLVKNVLEKLEEGPLRPLRIGANLGAFRPHFAQVFDSNGATMCSGVVYDHFGHDVIFVLRTSGLLTFYGSPQEFVKPLFSLSSRDWRLWHPIRLGDIGTESALMFMGTSALFETHRRAASLKAAIPFVPGLFQPQTGERQGPKSGLK